MNEGLEDHILLIFHRRIEDPELVVYLLKVDEKGQWLIKAMLFGETSSLCCCFGFAERKSLSKD